MASIRVAGSSAVIVTEFMPSWPLLLCSGRKLAGMGCSQ